MSGWWWEASYIGLWIVVLVLFVLVLALARQIGTLHMRLGPRGALEIDSEGPPLGEAPEWAESEDLAGAPIVVGGPGRPQFVLFVSPSCPVCAEVLPSLPAVARYGRMSPIVVADVGREQAVAAFDHHAVGAPVVPGPELARRWAVPGTPYVVVTDQLGVVRAKGTVNNLEQMEGLVDTARRRVERAVWEEAV